MAQSALGGVGGLTASGGTATIKALGLNELESNVGANVTLVVCGAGNHGWLQVNASRTNAGTIKLESEDACCTAILTVDPAAVLTNNGTIETDADGHIQRFLGGDLVNNGTLTLRRETVQGQADADWTNGGTFDLAAGVELGLLGGGSSSFTQTNGGVLKVGIDSATSFGSITGTQPLSLDGRLSIVRKKTYKPGNGTSFGIIAGASRTGLFDKLVKAKVAKTRYLKPVYSASAVNLVVDTVTLNLTPGTGPPGQAVTLTGNGFAAAESVALSFKDLNGTKTSLGNVTTDASGGFSVVKSVPANADSGVGVFSAKSAVTGMTAKKDFVVN